MLQEDLGYGTEVGFVKLGDEVLRCAAAAVVGSRVATHVESRLSLVVNKVM